MIKRLVWVLLGWVLMVSAVEASAVDSRGRNVPVQYDTDMKTLVEYLVKPYSREEDKARVILAWIVYHIDYDQYKLETMMDYTPRLRARKQHEISTGDIWQTRIGVCDDIAELYQRMALMAGLDSVVITGYAGNGVTDRNKGDFRHAWNAVKIDGTWEFVDPTWAMQGDYREGSNIVSKRQHAREIERRESGLTNVKKKRNNRQLDDRWFMTKPQEMIKTHFPDDAKWQLLARPRSFASFIH